MAKHDMERKPGSRCSGKTVIFRASLCLTISPALFLMALETTNKQVRFRTKSEDRKADRKDNQLV